MKTPCQFIDREPKKHWTKRLWGRCTFDSYTSPDKYSLIADGSRRLVDGLTLLIDTVLADRCDPPNEGMSLVIVRTEGSRDDVFCIRNVVSDPLGLPKIQGGRVLDGYLISFVVAQGSN